MRAVRSPDLGRGLINAQPQPYCGELNEGKVVRRQLVVTRCDSAAVFDPVEEPLAVTAYSIVLWAEADGVLAVALWWDIGPGSALSDKFTDSVKVICPVGEKRAVMGKPFASTTAWIFVVRTRRKRPTLVVAVLFAQAPCWWTRRASIFDVRL